MSDGITLEEFNKRLLDQASHLDFKDAFNLVSDLLCTAHAGYFYAQSEPSGTKWTALSKPAVESRFLRDLGGGKIGDGRIGKTKLAAARKAGLKPDKTILIDKGAMQSSVRFRGNSNHVENFTANEMVWGTSDPKAAIHQYGAERQVYDEVTETWKDVVIPARPFVGWSDAAIDKTVDIIADAAVEGLLAGI